jgi:hypothetical protein
MDDLLKIFGLIVVGVSALALVVGFAAMPVMLLWNWLMPDLFGLASINFWQALGVSALCGLLFKPFNSSSSK